jgi:succinate dehydrogenase / fumarate reductase, cytochrome b subunit
MNASAVRLDDRAARFWTATNGKKAVMALSGVVLTGFLVVHMSGNLQLFAGAERFNNYAHTLKALPALLWGTRAALLASVFLHVWSAYSLWRLKSEARPTGYVRKRAIASTYAARTMYWTGPILLLFIIYHLMQFTIGVGGTPFVETEPYDNVVAGFSVIPIALFYILAMGCLCYHLFHGVWSLFQTLGVNHPRYTPKLRLLAKTIAWVLFLGFSSVPVGVLTGVVQPTLGSARNQKRPPVTLIQGHLHEARL